MPGPDNDHADLGVVAQLVGAIVHQRGADLYVVAALHSGQLLADALASERRGCEELPRLPLTSVIHSRAPEIRVLVADDQDEQRWARQPTFPAFHGPAHPSLVFARGC